MRGKYLVVGILFLFMVSFVFAETTINIKTLPHHTVFVTPIKIGGGFDSLSTPAQGFSGEYGDLVVVFEDEEIENAFFNLNILVKDGDLRVHSEKVLDTFTVGKESDVIIALPEGVEPIYKNETVENGDIEEINSLENNSFLEVEEETLEKNISSEIVSLNQDSKEGPFLSVYTFVEENKPVFYTLYYLFLLVVLLSLVYFIFKKSFKSLFKGFKKRNKESKKGKIESLGDIEMGDLAKAEKELKKAQEKVEELRNKKKESLDEAKKKLIEAEKEIMKLRGVEIEEDKEVTTQDLKKRLEEKEKEEEDEKS